MQWIVYACELFDILQPNSDPDKFNPADKSFHYDQKSCARKMALTDQIDFNVVQKKHNQILQQLQTEKSFRFI